jgi:hypothetical protein
MHSCPAFQRARRAAHESVDADMARLAPEWAGVPHTAGTVLQTWSIVVCVLMSIGAYHQLLTCGRQAWLHLCEQAQSSKAIAVFCVFCRAA